MFNNLFRNMYPKPFATMPLNDNYFWGERIKIELSSWAYSKMVHYTQRANGEISGFGKINKIGNRIIVTNVKIFEQQCNSGYTSLDREALSNFLLNLVKKGENPAKWKLWWHSHNDFEVFWSATDETNILRHSQQSYLLSICINKDIEMVGRIDDKGQNSKIPIKVLPVRGKLKDRCYNEVRKKVKGGWKCQSLLGKEETDNILEEEVEMKEELDLSDIQDNQDLLIPTD